MFWAPNRTNNWAQQLYFMHISLGEYVVFGFHVLLHNMFGKTGVYITNLTRL